MGVCKCVHHTTQAEDVQPQYTQCASADVYGFARKAHYIFLNIITLSSIHWIHCTEGAFNLTKPNKDNLHFKIQ